MLLASLELSPTLQLSFVILNILKYEDDISIAKSLKFQQITALSAKQRKSWKRWKDEIVTSISKPLPEPLNGDDFESIKTLMFAEIEGIHTKYFEKAANEETFKAVVYQLKAQVESLFLSSKEFVNEINQWKALLERLELSPTLQLSFVILNILTLEDSILNFPETTDVLARQKKLWMLWKDEILTYKALPEPLNGEDFESIKKLMFAEIEVITTQYIEDAVDPPLFEDLYKLESQVERLVLSSKKSDTDIDPFCADINKNQVKNLVSSSKGHHNQLGVTVGATSLPVTQTPLPLPENKTTHPLAEDEKGRNSHLRAEKVNDFLKNRTMTWFNSDRIRICIFLIILLFLFFIFLLYSL